MNVWEHIDGLVSASLSCTKPSIHPWTNHRCTHADTRRWALGQRPRLASLTAVFVAAMAPSLITDTDSGQVQLYLKSTAFMIHERPSRSSAASHSRLSSATPGRHATWATYQIRKITFAGNAGNVYRGLAMPTCITARAWSTCRDACRDR